jgi:hypothetical protein
MEVYFPRMFNYIESNEEILFRKIESVDTNFLDISIEKTFKEHIIKDSNIDFSIFSQPIQDFIFVDIPTFYTKSLYNNSTNAPYINDIERMLFISLENCEGLKNFLAYWYLFNPTKMSDDRPFIETTIRSETLQKLLNTNPIFTKLYTKTIKDYNSKLKELKCEGKIIPEVQKKQYDISEMKDNTTYVRST